MNARIALAVALLLAPPLLAPGAPALPPAEPFDIYLEASGHFRVGLLAVGVGAVDDGDPVPEQGVGAVNFAVHRFEADDCLRNLRFHLDFAPRNASADVGLVYAAAPFQFQVRLYNDTSGEELPDATLNWQVPGTLGYNLEEATPVRLELFMLRGVEADYDLRVAGWKNPEAECRWQGQLFVNEVEANPPGSDWAGTEWVELFNGGFEDADLAGWTLKAIHGQESTFTFPEGTLLPRGERLVVHFPTQFLDNSDEEVLLVGPRGWVVDHTPPLSDSANNGRTWQRSPDGSEAWSFGAGTPGAANDEGFGGSSVSMRQRPATFEAGRNQTPAAQ